MNMNILVGLCGLVLAGGAAFGASQVAAFGSTHKAAVGPTHEAAAGSTHEAAVGSTHEAAVGSTHEAAVGSTQERSRARGDGPSRVIRARAMRPAERDGTPAHGLRARVRRGREQLRSLEVTPEQRELARQAARELAPLANELRPQARALLERARALRREGQRDGARAILRDELRPLLERAKPDAERAAAPILRSFTTEQRAKLEAAAKRRGESFDERRFSHRLGLLLGSRRMQHRMDRGPR